MRRADFTPGIVGGGLVVLIWLLALIVSGMGVHFLLLAGVLGLIGATLVRRSPRAAGVLQLIAGIVTLLLSIATLVSGISVLLNPARVEISATDVLGIVLSILGLVASVLLIIGAVQAFRQRRARPEVLS
jgi:hypothetical protein